jgi:hypothetical protein
VMTGMAGDAADRGTLGTPLLLPLSLSLPLPLPLPLLESTDVTRSAGLVTR